MTQTLLSPITSEEVHSEIEVLCLAMARTPRLASLIRYLGEKYQSNSAEITEYDIATEVFGRSKTGFNPNEDSIVRVETHRLRKRLNEYYASEGSRHSVRMQLPVGTYTPVFVRYFDPSTQTESAIPEDVPQATSSAAHGATPSSHQRLAGRKRLILLVTISVGLILAAIFLSKTLPHSKTSQSSLASRTSSTAEPSTLPSESNHAIRFLAGYQGVPQVDSAGQTWQEDMYFHGGAPQTVRANSPASRTSDAMLFRQWRTGDFTYDIPLVPGVYELHLYFIASNRENEEFATFQLQINGHMVLNDFDIVNDAEGENIADERVFRDVSPDKDGKLHLAFISERGVPVVNAIKILPGIAHKQLPVRILTQNSAFVDHDGNQWLRDNYFANGKMKQLMQSVDQTSDPGLYAGERYGHFSYVIPVDSRDRYTLVLHFVESYFGPDARGGGGIGSRVFRVLCNGSTLLDDFDIFKEAGSFHALTKTFRHVKPTAQGKLNITFEPITNYATVSALEVVDEGP